MKCKLRNHNSQRTLDNGFLVPSYQKLPDNASKKYLTWYFVLQVNVRDGINLIIEPGSQPNFGKQAHLIVADEMFTGSNISS